MSSKVMDLQNKYNVSLEKEAKLRQTLERHMKQAVKKVDDLRAKGVPIDLNNLKHCHMFKYDSESKATEHYWDICALESKGEDISNTQLKIKNQQEVTKKHYERLFKEQQKQADISNGVPPVILQFMEIWKEKVFSYFKQHYERSLAFDDKLDQEQRDAYITYGRTSPEYSKYFNADGSINLTFEHVNRWNSKGLNNYLQQNNLAYLQIRKRKLTYAGQMVNRLKLMYNEDERWRWLASTLEEDKQARIHKLVTSVRNITGDITDASNLCIGANGDLNGFVIGKNGVAEVKTIGAGGYNIQCYHFRTLIHPVNQG